MGQPITTLPRLPKGLLNYRTGTLPRSRSSKTHFQGGGFSWRHFVGLFFAEGPTTEDCNCSFTYSPDGLLTWEGPFVENNTTSANTDPAKLPYQPVYAIHWNAVVDNRLFILVKGYDEPGQPESEYRLWGKAIKRYEVGYVDIKVTNNSPLVEITWPKHGLRGGTTSEADSIKIKKIAAVSGLPGTFVATDFTGTPSSPLSFQVSYIGQDKIRITLGKSASVAGGGSVVTPVHLGVTFIPKGWREVLYSGTNFTDFNWEKRSEKEFLRFILIMAATSTSAKVSFDVMTASG